MTRLRHLKLSQLVVGSNPWIFAEDVGVGMDEKPRDRKALGDACRHVWWRPNLLMKEAPSSPWLPNRLRKLELKYIFFRSPELNMSAKVKDRLLEDKAVRKVRRDAEDEEDARERLKEDERMRRMRLGEEDSAEDEQIKGKANECDSDELMAKGKDDIEEPWPLDFVRNGVIFL
jgi:hypothetical protein